MKRKRWQIVLCLLGLCLVLIYFSKMTNGAKAIRVMCQDGEEFTIQEWGSIHTSTPAVKNEWVVIDTKRLRLIFYRDRHIV